MHYVALILVVVTKKKKKKPRWEVSEMEPMAIVMMDLDKWRARGKRLTNYHSGKTR